MIPLSLLFVFRPCRLHRKPQAFLGEIKSNNITLERMGSKMMLTTHLLLFHASLFLCCVILLIINGKKGKMSHCASHLANEPLESFPQLPYGSPAEFTLTKQMPGAGFAPTTQIHTKEKHPCMHKLTITLHNLQFLLVRNVTRVWNVYCEKFIWQLRHIFAT